MPEPTASQDGDAVVVFTPSGRRGRLPRGTSLLEAARGIGVDLDSICGGRGICGRCQVLVCEGDYPKHGIVSRPAHLSPLSATEERYAERRGLAPGRRLGCAARLEGDVLVDVPPESQVHKQVVRKRAEVRSIAVDPITRLHYVEMPMAELGEDAGDLRRLMDALSQQWGLAIGEVDFHVLRTLQRTLRKDGGKVTAAVRNERTVTALWPGFRDRLCGIAVDIGSTTLAGYLCDLLSGDVLASAGAMNPQIRFGEDLMSRVSEAMMNPDSVGAMAAAVRDSIDGLARETAEVAGIEPHDILEAVFVGNPIMLHLALGMDPSELGTAPFTLATTSAVTVRAVDDLGLALHPGARVYTLPCIAGHVGADTAAVVLSEAPHERDETTLIVDVGTNAEIVLATGGRLLACSSPTGPAFEGAQISCGQRASVGAVERVRIDPETLEPRIKVIGSDSWSDTADFDDTVTGVCGSGIIEAVAEMFLAGIVAADGLIDGTHAAPGGRVASTDGRVYSYRLWDGSPALTVTQNDVRAIQLAKAALYAGARLLMDRAGIDSVDRIVFAGAFGSHIDPRYAMILGLIPDCDIARVQSAGNAAGTGARIALLNRQARQEVEALTRRIEKVETAIEPAFQAHFVDAIAFPHATHPFPNLSRAVDLPQTPTKAPGRRRGGKGATPAATPTRSARPGRPARRSPSE